MLLLNFLPYQCQALCIYGRIEQQQPLKNGGNNTKQNHPTTLNKKNPLLLLPKTQPSTRYTNWPSGQNMNTKKIRQTDKYTHKIIKQKNTI